MNIYQNTSNNRNRFFFAEVKIEGQPFEVDLGSGYTFLLRKVFNSLKINSLQSTTIKFHSYSNEIFVSHEKTRVKIDYKNITRSIQKFSWVGFFDIVVIFTL